MDSLRGGAGAHQTTRSTIIQTLPQFWRAATINSLLLWERRNSLRKTRWKWRKGGTALGPYRCCLSPQHGLSQQGLLKTPSWTKRWSNERNLLSFRRGLLYQGRVITSSYLPCLKILPVETGNYQMRFTSRESLIRRLRWRILRVTEAKCTLDSGLLTKFLTYRTMMNFQKGL